jgi:hypothetical protein
MVDLIQVDEALQNISGTVIIDAKAIYDVLISDNQPIQLSEKRADLELLAYVRNAENNNTETRWVHGEANLADGLTKLGHHPMLREFLETSTWCFVHDSSQLSGKKRKAKGLDPLKQADVLSDDDSFSALAWKQLALAYPEFTQNDSEDDEMF